MERGKAITITLDDVLVRSEDGPDAAPRDGAVEFVAALRERGYEVVLLTVRDPARVRQWLAAHGFAETHAQAEITPARAHLSVRALRFDGGFAGLLERIEQWEE